MVLNNKPQMYTIYFPSNWFYKSVVEKWEPIIKRMKLPYETVADFMNNQIQSLVFPNVALEDSVQQRGQYQVAYSQGKEVEPVIGKDITIMFKLTESYASYFIMSDQIDTFMHYHSRKEDPTIKIWMEPITLAFLTDSGYMLTSYTLREITPKSLSELNLSYAAQIASYNTFSFGFKYNRFDIDII